MYHSIGSCVFLFLEAVLTFEQQHIAKASEAIKQCLAICNQYRKKNTISESIGKTFKRVSILNNNSRAKYNTIGQLQSNQN